MSRDGARTPLARTELGVVFVLAFAVRTALVFRGGGGLSGDYQNDAGIYYASADALTHGLLPYQDYALVHPPMIALVGVPFAVLGRITDAHSGFIAENLAFTAFAALAAVFVTLAARRFGFGRGPALIAGLVYAGWIGSITSEYLTRLEPLGNLLLAAALYVLAVVVDSRGRGAAVGCGVLLGCLVNVKIWWVVPAVLILLWLATDGRATRLAGWALAGGLGACAVIDLPFLIITRGRMFDSLVSAQLGRADSGRSVFLRLEQLTGVQQLTNRTTNINLLVDDGGAIAGVVVMSLLFVSLAALAVTRRPGRLAVALVAAQVVVVFCAPSWYQTYCDYLAVPLALMAGAAAASVAAGRTAALRRWTGVTTVAVTAVVTLLAMSFNPLRLVSPVRQTSAMSRAVSHSPCITSVNATALILVNGLDRSFAPGCHDWVDVKGASLGGGADPVTRLLADGPRGPFSRVLYDYLRSSDAIILLNRRDRLRVLDVVGPTRYRELVRRRILIVPDGMRAYRGAR